MKKQATRKAPPKKLQAVQTSRHFRVAPHRHSGHVTPHRTTSYPVLAMVLLIAGVFLASWTQMVTADWNYPGPSSGSYSVNLKVPGPPPTQAATIDSPTTGTSFSEVPITVRGSCPLNTYVELLRNNFSSGDALCDSTGHYSLQTDLFNDTNQLIARVHSTTDLAGPDSDKVTVYYKHSAPAAGSSGSVAGAPQNSPGVEPGANAATAPLLLKTAFNYQGFYVGDWAHWQLEVSGGAAPYAIAVDWGDNHHDLYSRARDGPMSIEHQYQKQGGYKGSYIIRVNVSDGQGNHSFLQLLAIINNPPGITATTQPGKGTPGGNIFTLTKGVGWLTSGGLGRMVRYAWPAYGVTVLMLASFWLGERHELRLLRPHRHKTRHA